jgi:lipopolysaccharide transport system ATP-binding protein
MADDVVIRAERLGKKYTIGHEPERERYVALRDVIARAARGAWRRTQDMVHGRAIVAGDSTEEFWALKDVSFEVKRGEVLGIIGRNGAGKSTLLKILSRVTEPSEGRVTIKGRVASLLEIGTGFHLELTGRENIYLNGTILGMRRAEIRRKFDEIVAFAEVERFLDTPIKRYSSGMYVRLAFAVAAHLEPEILLVDEVLAVGDAEFQNKCLGTMRNVAERGRTILFVSHNLDALRRTCCTGVVLSRGRVNTRGGISECVEAYHGLSKRIPSDHRLHFPSASRERHHVIGIEMLDSEYRSIARPTTWDSVIFAIRVHSPRRTPNASVIFQISTLDGFLVTLCSTRPDQNFETNFDAGENIFYLRFDSIALSAGSYVVGVGLAIPNVEWLYNEPYGAVIEVGPRDVYNAGLSPTVRRYPVPMCCHWEKATAPVCPIVHELLVNERAPS